jgi:hypothetical protein
LRTFGVPPVRNGILCRCYGLFIVFPFTGAVDCRMTSFGSMTWGVTFLSPFISRTNISTALFPTSCEGWWMVVKAG